MTRILLVEDNRDFAATLGANLEREGYEVAIAATGADGLARAKVHRPDLIGLAALALVIRFAGGSIMTALRHAHGMH